MTDKEKFMKSWDSLMANVGNLLRVTEANRRLIAGMTKLLIEKEVLDQESVSNLEKEVSDALNRSRKKKKKKRPRKEGK